MEEAEKVLFTAVKNDVCGIGVAYDAKVAGLRILSGPITDVEEAAALNYNFQETSIYSCSWGPPDDGRSMDAPSKLIQKAILNGIQNGRGGKGSLYVFASGNGGSAQDQCNFDGYTNSIYSVTVAAVDYQGQHPSYSEACAANMVVTYSSGSGKYIYTTDVGQDRCSSSHSGTSAAAPLAVGIFALALQVRPDLSWRDIQHLCVTTAVQINADDPDWELTAAGRPFSYKYGFGKLDASLFVAAAKEWQLVKPQTWIETKTIELGSPLVTEMLGGLRIVPGGIRSSLTVTRAMCLDNNFEKLEHVTVRVWISHAKRGDVTVELYGPSGVKSLLAATRKFDYDPNGFSGWQFMTLKHWDENPVGEWTLEVSDIEDPDYTGSVLAWNMILWGSAANASDVKLWTEPDDTVNPPALFPLEEPFDSSSPPAPTDSITTPQGLGNPSETSVEFVGLHDTGKSILLVAGLVGSIICALIASVYLWRRHKRRAYTIVPADEHVNMEALDASTIFKLRDASDSEDEQE